MAHFVLKLNPPRPGFAVDMDQEEAALMREHAGYWVALLEKGGVVVFGPVMDPKGAYGLGVAEFADASEARQFADGDPVIQAGRGFSYEINPMQAMTRNSAP